jgi:general secretion pathway protein G
MKKPGNERGFSLLEAVVVMSIIAILAAVALPNYHRAVIKAKESVLKENLYWMRDAIDQYYVDNEKYPQSLRELVEKNYLREIPVDPITEEKDWRIIYEEFDEFADPNFEPGVWDVRSTARGRSTEGTRYRSW